jgi:hypothetical protein
MASVIDYSDLTLNDQEALEVSQAVFEDVYVSGPLSNFHYIQTGIKMKTQIPFFGLLPMLGQKSTGCTPNAESGLDLTEKFWDPELIDFRLTHCQSDVEAKYKMWEKIAKKAADTWETMDNGQMQFIVDRAKNAHTEAILRLSSFADEAAAAVGSGGNVTAAGYDVLYWSMLDGLWDQIFVGVAATTVDRTTITENGLASYALQGALGDTVALDCLRGMYEGIDPRAFTGGTLKYQVTKSLLNNWQALLEDKSLANAVLDKVEKDRTTPYSYRGIPIEVRYDWDRNIATYFDTTVVHYLPHRAILTPIENIPIGTSDEESMNSIASFYDKVTRQWYYDGASFLDVKLLEEHKITVAY